MHGSNCGNVIITIGNDDVIAITSGSGAGVNGSRALVGKLPGPPLARKVPAPPEGSDDTVAY